MNYVSLSKTISLALRHKPWQFELELDDRGWVLTDQLLTALRENPKWEQVTLEDLKKLNGLSDKKRFELTEDKIRALYGHSVETKILKEQAEPPSILYHGTAKRFTIKNKGLIPKGRQYVHLSEDTETALQVGSRRDSKPILLTINAALAWQKGILFYKGNDKVWLADPIPPGFIDFGDQVQE